jgi:DNA-binding NarL/FixJ family response regulator
MNQEKSIIRIAIADDHALFAQSLANLMMDHPEYKTCFSYSDGNNLLDLIRQHQPHILILDINIPPYNGLELIDQIKAIHSSIKILIVSMHQPAELKLTPLNLKADGYLLKTAGKGEFINALQTISHTQEKFFSADIKWFKENKNAKTEPYIITKREKEIIRMIKEGFTSKEIASKLNISEHTVKTHRAHIREKLNVTGVAQLLNKYNRSI